MYCAPHYIADKTKKIYSNKINKLNPFKLHSCIDIYKSKAKQDLFDYNFPA